MDVHRHSIWTTIVVTLLIFQVADAASFRETPQQQFDRLDDQLKADNTRIQGLVAEASHQQIQIHNLKQGFKAELQKRNDHIQKLESTISGLHDEVNAFEFVQRDQDHTNALLMDHNQKLFELLLREEFAIDSPHPVINLPDLVTRQSSKIIGKLRAEKEMLNEEVKTLKGIINQNQKQRIIDVNQQKRCNELMLDRGNTIYQMEERDISDLELKVVELQIANQELQQRIEHPVVKFYFSTKMFLV